MRDSGTVVSGLNTWWTDPSVPEQQLSVVLAELTEIQSGNMIPPYLQFFECLKRIKEPIYGLLDLGAGCGHYGAALKLLGHTARHGYVAYDISQAFRAVAARQFPWMNYHVGDTAKLPFGDAVFQVVLSSACLMYAEDPERDAWEAMRVSSQYVLFHRTPLAAETVLLEQEAYGGTVCERRWKREDLFAIFEACGLSLVHEETIFENPDGYAHKTFLLKKDSVVHVHV